jgi:hypothetical protein
MELFEKKGFQDMAVINQFFGHVMELKKSLGHEFCMPACPMLENSL